MFKLNRQQPALGLDISDLSLKFLQFSSGSFGSAVQAYGDALIPSGAYAQDKIADERLIIKAIRKALGSPKYGRVTTPFVVASIPETKSFVRVIQMTALSEKEAQEAVPWEAETYIPIPIGQVYLDWVILGRNPAEEKMTVLITAAPKDYVDQIVSIIKAANLRPLALEVESQATARSLVSRSDETVLIANIDALRTSLIIYDKGILQFTSSLPIAGKVFTQSISRALGIDFEEAEKLKRAVGLDERQQQGAVKKALVPILNNLIEELINTIRFYEEHSSNDSKVTRFLLTGGASKLRHLPSFLHDRLTHRVQTEHALRSLPGLRVELGNPWVNVLKKGQTPPLSREDSLGYATAIGLAVREVDT